ncbi:unnamed protein product [Rotaria sp. Silwood1]|nr:unnamed protein product [Rotaria sp. Silwood1]
MHITPHGTTTFSPFQIMFGRENLLLMDPQQMKVSLSKPNQYYEKVKRARKIINNDIIEYSISKKIKLSVVQACAEFSALDDRASDTMKENSFQNLAQVLFDAGRALTKSSIQVQAILPNPTTAIN